MAAELAKKLAMPPWLTTAESGKPAYVYKCIPVAVKQTKPAHVYAYIPSAVKLQSPQTVETVFAGFVVDETMMVRFHLPVGAYCDFCYHVKSKE